MFDKINGNLSEQIFRYIFQMRINIVNKQFLSTFKFNDSRKSLESIELFIDTFICFPQYVSMNHRVFKLIERTSPDTQYGVFVRSINRIDFKNKIIKLYPTILLSVNYIYTSTKYLMEIKKRGINSLR